jgi:hypothetical protein
MPIARGEPSRWRAARRPDPAAPAGSGHAHASARAVAPPRRDPARPSGRIRAPDARGWRARGAPPPELPATPWAARRRLAVCRVRGRYPPTEPEGYQLPCRQPGRIGSPGAPLASWVSQSVSSQYAQNQLNPTVLPLPREMDVTGLIPCACRKERAWAWRSVDHGGAWRPGVGAE